MHKQQSLHAFHGWHVQHSWHCFATNHTFYCSSNSVTKKTILTSKVINVNKQTLYGGQVLPRPITREWDNSFPPPLATSVPTSIYNTHTLANILSTLIHKNQAKNQPFLLALVASAKKRPRIVNVKQSMCHARLQQLSSNSHLVCWRA